MNKTIIMGRLGQDPELRRTVNDIAVTSFSIAVKRRFAKDDTTDWIDCTAWRNTAEFICKYFKKGDQILIEGSLQTGSYEDKNGNKIKTTDILVEQVYFCGGNAKKEAPESQNIQEDFQLIATDEDLPF